MTLTPLTRAFAPFILSAALAAGQGAPAPKAPQADAAEAANPAFRSRIFILQHRSPNQLRDILAPLMSGARGTMIQAMDRDGLQVLSVRDFPENLAAIEEAVKRLDVAPPAARQIEFHIHVLLASKEPAITDPAPAEIQDALASLRSTLSYRTYTPLASFVQRAADGLDFIRGNGVAEMPVKTARGQIQMEPMDLGWDLQQLTLSEAGGKAEIHVQRFDVSVAEHGVESKAGHLAQVSTNLSMKDGDKVVLGTSMIRDKALIVVVTAKVLD